MPRLTLEQQLFIIQTTIKNRKIEDCGWGVGLCKSLRSSIRRTFPEISLSTYVQPTQYIPIFNRWNAVLFGHARAPFKHIFWTSPFWWEPFDDTSRDLFLKWMEMRIQKKLIRKQQN